MRNIVTEDIVRNALNESIDEFMLEEGMLGNGFKGLQNWWNNGNGQKIKNGLNNAWNGYKNFLAMYMDNKTNGQWNNQYGIYANGSGKTTELYYLEKWFGYHLDNIRQIERRNDTPAADFSRSREYVERNGERVYTDTEIQEKDTLTYVQKNITPNNFNTWIKKFIKDRQALKLIDNYILKCQKHLLENSDVNTAVNCLSISAFMSDDEGQKYLKTKQSDLQNQRSQYSANNDKNSVDKLRYNLQQEASNINTFFSQLQTFLKNYNDSIEYFMDYSFDNYFMKYFENYLNSGNKNTIQRINLVKDYVDNLWNVWKQAIKNKPNKLKQFINQISYNVFLKNEQGKRYWFLQRQMGVYGNK